MYSSNHGKSLNIYASFVCRNFNSYVLKLLAKNVVCVPFILTIHHKLHTTNVNKSNEYSLAHHTCMQQIQYISMWLSSIFLNAKLIIGTLSDVITSDKFGILDAAIRRLGLSTVPLLAVKSLTRALTVIVQMKLPTDDHYLDTVLRSCLSGMMSAILLEKSCRSESIIVAPGWQSMKYIGNDLRWNHSANEYRDFLVSFSIKFAVTIYVIKLFSFERFDFV